MQQVLVGGWKIAAMAVSAVIALGLPIFLLIFWRRKTGAKWTSALCGALIFVVFVYGLENALHQLCIYGQTPISAFLKTTPGRICSMRAWQPAFSRKRGG